MKGVDGTVQSMLVGMLAETPLHPGSGQSLGAIDLPVQREATTGYPVIPGSSLKGALRDYVKTATDTDVSLDAVFGQPEQAAEIGFSDGRLLLLPLRSLGYPYLWVTCPYILERLARDLQMAGQTPNWTPPKIAEGSIMTVFGSESDSMVFIEEYAYEAMPSYEDWSSLVKALGQFVKHPQAKARLSSQLAIISDDAFGHFARFGLSVRARNKLSGTKQSESLWYEEILSVDTLFYFLGIARGGEDTHLKTLQSLMQASPYLQIGGHESVGEGWCVLNSVSMMPGGKGA